ncbi:MAG: hypothetical protein HY422_02670 [Candidatus Komeilibacteria bacterium]|nr:hypothetical protein [Candidatus Komeilibacteria bacterium]
MKLKELTKQQKQYLAVGGVAILVVIIWALASKTQAPAPSDSPENNTEQTGTSTPTTTPPQKPAAAQPSKTAIDQALAYSKALEQYKGRIIQFNQNCQAYPAVVTFKSGTAVMFDNRSPKPITIALDTNKFSIKAYDYLAMKVTSKVLPKTISLDCNSSYNVGQVHLEQ